MFDVVASFLGSLGFGAVVGWITYRTLRRRRGAALLTDIAVIVGAVGGAAITSLFKSAAMLGGYGIGLAVGFFGYLRVAGKSDDWMDEVEKEN